MVTRAKVAPKQPVLTKAQEIFQRAARDPFTRKALARKSLAFFAWYYLRAENKPLLIPECHLNWYREIGWERKKGNRTLLLAPRAHGKCLQVGTLVLMYDGRRVPVEDVQPGDQLMGPDSTPRTVLSTTRGHGPLFRIVPNKGDPWVCNDAHILTVEERGTGELKDIPVLEWLQKSKWFKSTHRQVAVGVEFPPGPALPVDPYFLGVWFGDGSKQFRSQGLIVTTKDQEIVDYLETIAAANGLRVVKHEAKDRCPQYRIRGRRWRDNPLLAAVRALVGEDAGNVPEQYLTSTRANRLAFLAGWIDTDGNAMQGGYEVTQKRRDYADAVAFLARSLGFRATVRPKVVNDKTYWHIGIRGRVSEIPVRIARKRIDPYEAQYDTTRTNFEVESAGEGDWAGFTLDGDGRFLLGDFTVTHNTMVTGLVVPLHAICFDPNIRILLVCESDPMAMKRFRRLRTQLESNERIIADFGGNGGFRDPTKPWTDHQLYVRRSDSSLVDPTLEAVGAGGAVTGGRFDLIIADDPESPKTTLNETVRAKTREWFWGTILELLEPWGEALTIGTRKHGDDLYHHIKQDPTFRVIEDRAFPDGLPDAWEEIKDDKGRVVNARVTAGSRKTLWPERWPAGRLLVKYISARSKAVWIRENQNEVVSDAEAQFKLEWLKAARKPEIVRWTHPAEVPSDWAIVISVDPAFVDDEDKAQSTDSDYFVVMIWAVNLVTWKRRLVGGWRRRGLTPEDFKGKLLRTVTPWALQTDSHPAGPLKYVAIELNSFGKFYHLGLRRSSALPLAGHHTSRKKADLWEGVPAMTSLFENDQVEVALGAPHPPLVDMLDDETDDEYEERCKRERKKQLDEHAEFLVFVDAWFNELHKLGSEAHDDTVMCEWIAECVIRKLHLFMTQASERKDIERRSISSRDESRDDDDDDADADDDQDDDAEDFYGSVERIGSKPGKGKRGG